MAVLISLGMAIGFSPGGTVNAAGMEPEALHGMWAALASMVANGDKQSGAIERLVPNFGPFFGSTAMQIQGNFPAFPTLNSLAVAERSYAVYLSGIYLPFDASQDPILSPEAINVIVTGIGGGSDPYFVPLTIRVLDEEGQTVETISDPQINFRFLPDMLMGQLDNPMGIEGDPFSFPGTYPVTAAITSLAAANKSYAVYFGNTRAQFDVNAPALITPTAMNVVIPEIAGTEPVFRTITSYVFDDLGRVVFETGGQQFQIKPRIIPAPVLTLLGDGEITLECGANFVDPGATASDENDGDITDSIVVTGMVNTSVPGEYTLVYSVTNSGNVAAAPVSRTVTVEDTTSPVVTLLADDTVFLECGGAFQAPTATATDSCAGNLNVQVDSSEVNVAVPGIYAVTFTATDPSQNVGIAVQTVVVRDTTAPVIQLLGSARVTVFCGGTYQEAGATASDTCTNGSLQVSIDSSAVDTDSSGEYEVVYTTEDAAGNEDVAVRIVEVLDVTAPVITVLGSNPVVLECGSGPYVDAGATAQDGCDTALPAITLTGNTVNTGTPGDFTLTYRVTDASGNQGAATRTVQVKDSTPPVITLLEPGDITLACGSAAYEDTGATAVDTCGGAIEVEADASAVRTDQPGSYAVLFSATDAAGNEATLSRNVTVAGNCDENNGEVLAGSDVCFSVPGPVAEDSTFNWMFTNGEGETTPLGVTTKELCLNDVSEEDSGLYFTNYDDGVAKAFRTYRVELLVTPPCDPPAAPTGVSATDGASRSLVRISWNPSPTALGYEIFRATTDAIGDAVRIGVTPRLFFDDRNMPVPAAGGASGCNPGMAGGPQTLFYWVRSVNVCGGPGPFSASDSGTLMGKGLAGLEPRFAKALPASQPHGTALGAGAEDSLWLRIHAPEPIDKASVWGVAGLPDGSEAPASWVWSDVDLQQDGWLVYTPEQALEPGRTVVLAGGAKTVSGSTVMAEQQFVIAGALDAVTDGGVIAIELAGFEESGSPVTLALPGGGELEDFELQYRLPGLPEETWVPAASVSGLVAAYEADTAEGLLHMTLRHGGQFRWVPKATVDAAGVLSLNPADAGFVLLAGLVMIVWALASVRTRKRA
ncbi:MAG: DUF5011 domain-containing protein [Candidatus Hydrogenedentes bacterium]|nr:DUF5011 domain-containing protein [Candidatus Hydrogenedentota bacterium]